MPYFICVVAGSLDCQVIIAEFVVIELTTTVDTSGAVKSTLNVVLISPILPAKSRILTSKL